MRGNETIVEKLRTLEEHLLDPTVRRSSSQVRELLADDFIEFGSSGRVYDKPTVIEALKQDPGFDGPRTISNFNARELSPSVALVTYQIVESSTLRSSIWRFDGDRWQMVFHQGTRTN
jgi:hypothetical protein